MWSFTSLGYVLAAEIFPASVRTTALSICSGVSRVGVMLCFFITSWEWEPFNHASYLFPAALNIILLPLTIAFTPETLGKPLPITVDDFHSLTNSKT